MSKYAEYDSRLLSLITDGCNTFDALARRLADANKQLDQSADRWRVTDRRLQALRRAGKIVFNHSRKSWHLNEVREVPQ